MPRKKNPIGKLEVSFGMSPAMAGDLELLRGQGIAHANIVRKVIDHLSEPELLKIPEWPTPPKKRGLTNSKHYAVTAEQHAKVNRLKDAGVPVYDVIRHGIAMYLSIPIAELFKDESLLLYWKKQELGRRKLRDRKRNQTVSLKRVAGEALRSSILESLNMKSEDYLRGLAVKVRRGIVSAGSGESTIDTLVRRYGLTDEEARRVQSFAADITLRLDEDDGPDSQTSRTDMRGPHSVDAFNVTALVDDARSALKTARSTDAVEAVLEAKKRRRAEQEARDLLEAKGFTSDSIPDVQDLAKVRGWLEEAAKTGNLSEAEIETMWIAFLKKKEAAESLEATEARLILDTTKDGKGYIRNDRTKQIVGGFNMPDVELGEFKANAIPEAGVVELFAEDGRKFRLPLEPVTDEERRALGEALQDHAIYDMLTTELQRFNVRGAEELSDHHMTELYIAVRDRLYREIEKGNLNGFSKTECEAVLTRTIKAMRSDFGMPAFGVIDNGDELTEGEKALGEWKGE